MTASGGIRVRLATTTGFLVVAALLSLAAAMPAAAQSGVSAFEDYADRVRRAHDAASSSTMLVETREEAHGLAVELDRLLPATEDVRLDDTVVHVDNSVLRAQVADLDAAETSAGRRKAAEELAEHTASLAQAVGAVEAGEIPSDPDALEELLAGGQERGETLGGRLTELLERATEWFGRLLSRLGVAESESGATVARTIVWVLAGLLVIAAGWFLVRLVRSFSGRERHKRKEEAEEVGETVVSAAEGLPPDALRYAQDLAAEERFREAVRALFGGAARRLVEEGIVRQTRTLTNAELLAAVQPVSPALERQLLELSDGFEVAWYGHEDPGRDGFDRARERYRRVMQAAESFRRHRSEGAAGGAP